MRFYTQEKIDEVLEKHKEWLIGEKSGERADFVHANLTGANLRYANLYGVNLRGANLTHANLIYADLTGANLADTNLTGANLYRAQLKGANLEYAILIDVNLAHANLKGVNLTRATLPDFNIPQEGDLIVWKNGIEGLIKLCIPDGAKRTGSLVGRKCRAEYAKVLGTETGEPIRGKHDDTFLYTPGAIVKPDSYDDDIRVECTHGIHFFLTREEARRWY